MFSNLYPPVITGSSVHVATLSRELAERGNRVIVITPRIVEGSAEFESSGNIQIHRIPALRFPKLPLWLNFPWMTYTFTIGNLKRIRKILQEEQPDVLHLHNHIFDLAFSAALMRRWTGVPLILTVHTMLRHVEGFYNLILVPIDRFVLKPLVVNLADAVICLDKNVSTYVSRVFGNKRIAIVPHAIQFPHACSQEEIDDLRGEYGLRGDKIILSLGHLHALRNRKDLVRALPWVLKEIANVKLVIVGHVGDASVMALARSLGVERHIVLTGAVPYSRVPAFLAAADLEAHWLNQDEPERTSLGTASLEAMAAGKTVVAAASENTYGPGILKSGENVVLLESRDPRYLAETLVGLLRDEEKSRAIGERARQTILEHFSLQNICSKVLDVYRSVLVPR
ncbi:MAG: glycosyltransferase family 4 protein [Candidatus Omnitrophota bacterium]|nr:glycosyltransferase family 4 protein [Candidatus Omnitrophota bacterium]